MPKSKMFVSSESKPSIKCINCARPILPSKIGIHLKECMAKKKADPPKKTDRSSNLYGVKSSISGGDFDEYGGFSASKSSMF
jgi:hypothetical protein